MLLLARKKPLFALLLAILNAMIAGNAMSAERVLAREEDHLRFHSGQNVERERPEETPRQEIVISRSTSRAIDKRPCRRLQAELHLLDK